MLMYEGFDIITYLLQPSKSNWINSICLTTVMHIKEIMLLINFNPELYLLKTFDFAQ